jgi:hypothetical protein
MRYFYTKSLHKIIGPTRFGSFEATLFALLFVCFTALPTILSAQSGVAFRDFNGDGAKTGAEPGVEGVLVRLYGVNDVLVGTTVTNSSGNFNFATSVTSGRAANPGEKLRIEFEIPGSFQCSLENDVDFPGSNGNTYGSSVQFITGLQSGILFALNYPGQWVPNPNPKIFLPCYTFGDPTLANNDVADKASLVMFNFLDNGIPAAHLGGQAGVASPTMLANYGQVAALYGTAFSKQSQKVFTSAVMRRHCAFGPLGPGGIYMVDPFAATPVVTNFLDLDAIGIETWDHAGSYPANPGNNTSPVSGYIGTSAQRGLVAHRRDPSTDYAAGDQVGKVSLGNIDISDDGRYMYVMNLWDRKIYEIDLVDPANPQAPTALTKATRVRSWDTPDPATNNQQGEHRPWAVKFSRGKLYVGIVLSGQNIIGNVVSPVTGSGNSQIGTELRGYVYELDLGTSTFTNKLDFSFDYGRERSWIPWGYRSGHLSRYFSGDEREVAEPIIVDIDFDDQGDMLIGIMDRKGHQYAINNNDYSGNFVNYEYASAGELLRANESVPGCTYTIVTRPGTADYYDDNLKHPESIQGGIAVLPGGGDATAVWLDPIDIRSGGVIRLDNNTGKQVVNSAYEVFEDRFTLSQGGPGASGASKANGLGDAELSGDAASIEIGNRIWNDSGSPNGIQDPGEPGIGNIVVELYADFDNNGTPDGAALATTTTSSAAGKEGTWYFNYTNVPDGDPTAAGNQAGPQPNRRYLVQIGPASWAGGYGAGVLNNMILTTSNVAAAITQPDWSDNDAILNNSIPTISYLTGASGQNDHTLDMGFICNLPPSASFIGIPAQCAGGTGSNNGRIVMVHSTNVDKYDFSLGNTYTGAGYSSASAVGAPPFDALTGISNAGGTYTIRVFSGTDQCYKDYTVTVPVSSCPTDPLGFIYCEETGAIINSGSISVTGPGSVIITLDGSTGAYQFFTDGTPGTYTVTYTPPAGYMLSTTRLPAGTLDPTGQPNPDIIGAGSSNGSTLDNYSAGANPFYMVFDLAPGDPEVRLNNIPLKGCCSPVCGQTTVSKNN